MTEPTKQVHPVTRFKGDLAQLRDAGELDMLPKSVSYDAFRNAAIVAVTDNPRILTCDRASVFKAIRTLAAAGLVPDGREAAIVPFSGQAQAMPMVSGLIKVARNSGKIQSLWAEVVYEGEEFVVWADQGERKFRHDYDPLKRSGVIRGAYAVAKLSDGTVDMEPMSMEQIEKRRRASANQKGDKPTGIWAQWPEEMIKKTVIRSLCKRLPMSTEDMERLMKEQDAVPMRDITPERPTETLAQRFMATAAPVAPQEPEPTPAATVEDAVPADFDEDSVDPMTDEYDEGFKASQKGLSEVTCPYEAGTFEWNNWLGGHRFFQANKEKAE